jgi:hypothetical protein
MKMMEV